jgi:hypothetical protein
MCSLCRYVENRMNWKQESKAQKFQYVYMIFELKFLFSSGNALNIGLHSLSDQPVKENSSRLHK